MADKKNNPTGKKPVFNFYWIYIVIIVILILMALFRWEGGISKTTYPEFQVEMLQKGHVKEVLVINKAVAEVTIKKDFLNRIQANYIKQTRAVWEMATSQRLKIFHYF